MLMAASILYFCLGRLSWSNLLYTVFTGEYEKYINMMMYIKKKVKQKLVRLVSIQKDVSLYLFTIWTGKLNDP